MSLVRRFGAPIVLLALATACADPATAPAPAVAPAGGSTASIVNGTYAGNLFPSVGALLYDFNGDGVLNGDDEDCTGALISPTVFLTAAHCVEFFPAGTQLYVSFSPDLYAKGVKTIAATSWAFDPGYGHDNGNLHDEAVLILPAGATKGLVPYKLPTAGALDRMSAQGGLNGAVFYNVGYGTSATRTGTPGFGYDGRRNYSESTFLNIETNWLLLSMNTAATGLGGDCYGDSGGPKLLKSDPTVIYGTVTTGDYVCRSTTKDFRTDTPTARAFLGQFVTLP